jgi:hypothetical protein
MLMPEIDNETLIIAIQAVATEIRALREAVASGVAEPEEYQLLEERTRAAHDLEAAYEKLAVNTLNLPPYSELIAG